MRIWIKSVRGSGTLNYGHDEHDEKKIGGKIEQVESIRRKKEEKI